MTQPTLPASIVMNSTLETQRRRVAAPRLLLAASLTILLGAEARAQHGHLNAGSATTAQDAKLVWANAALFVSTSGFAQNMPMASSGVYSGLFNSGPTLTALPGTIANGGPSAFASAPGSFIQFTYEILSAPEGGKMSFWEGGATSATYTFGLGETSPLIPLSGGEGNTAAGAPGADPFGHIHGRRFTTDTPGEYILGLTAIDTSANGLGGGPIHLPSDQLSVRFVANAIPEPGTLALAALGLAGWLAAGRRQRRRATLAAACLAAALSAQAALVSSSGQEPPPLPPSVIDLVATNASLPVPQWIAAVTNAPIPALQKAQALLMILPKVDREGQRRAAHAAVRHVEDSHHAILRRVVMQPGWHPQVMSVFMTDTLKRKTSVKMPMLLALAKAEGHPLQRESLQLLGLLLSKDHGSDWEAWSASVAAWIDRHPD